MREHKTAHVLTEVTGEAQQLLRQRQPLVNLRIVRIQPGTHQMLGHGVLAIKPEVLLGKAVDQRVVHP